MPRKSSYSSSRRGGSRKRVYRSGVRVKRGYASARKGGSRRAGVSARTGRGQTVRIVVEHRNQPVGTGAAALGLTKPKPAPRRPQF